MVLRQELLGKLSATMRTLIWQSHKRMSELVDANGVTVPQAIVLTVLEQLGGRCTMSDLARLTHQSGATLTGIVDRLIHADFTVRDRDVNDRRVVHVMLTGVGRAKLAELHARREADSAVLMAALSNAELEQLEHLFAKILQAMEPSPDSPTSSPCLF
ncbi:MAG: MarR family transcriptional regulator [Herpetosiphonaceae bacterium]|nr:MarR family transcriptional regulator [Herpetosiphonaceae bacterium]